MSELLTIAQQLLPTLLLLVLGLVVAHFLATAIAKSGMSNSRTVGRIVRLSAIALVAVLALHQIYTINTSSSARSITFSQKHWQKGTQDWANVAVGGGGYVTGIYLHPRQKNLVYIRTDMGGFYRWNPAEERWIPLTDQFPMRQQNYYGGEALALDPNNPNVVYIAAGKYLWEKGALFKSVNQGRTWTKLNLELPFGGNERKRWAGERLVVNPFDSNVLLLGTRQDGLWRSSDAGKTWKQIKAFPKKGEEKIGINSIAFDTQRSGIVYASAYGDGIYESDDAGVTWRELASSPRRVNRLVVASNGILYAAGSGDPKVSKYVKGQWQDITPTKTKEIFNALTVNPTKPDEIMVALGETIKTKIFQSKDGGATWTEQERKANYTVPWSKNAQFLQPWIADLEFDPHVPNRVWLTDWYGIWRTDQLQQKPVVWTTYVDGHEEIVVVDLAAPSQGPLLLSGALDVEGFYHDNGLDEAPSRKLGLSNAKRGYQGTTSIAYSEKNPLNMVRVGGRTANNRIPIAVSNDGGWTWKPVESFPDDLNPTRLAMSATNPNNIVVKVREAQARYTKDGGKTWKSVDGLPPSDEEPRFVPASLAADKVDGNVFYYYVDGEVFRSEDGGASFQEVNDTVPKSKWHVVRTVPGAKGEVWLGLDDEGLYRSVDGGKTFSKIESVEETFLFAFGKPPADRQVPALYIYGELVKQGKGIFRSLDQGKTWVKINDDRNPIGNRPMVLEASQQEYGLVFVGTNGRGIYYRHTGNIQS